MLFRTGEVVNMSELLRSLYLMLTSNVNDYDRREIAAYGGERTACFIMIAFAVKCQV